MSDHAADVQPARRERVFVPLRWFIAAAAAQGLMMSAHPFCEDEWIEAGATSSLEEGAMRWCISLVLMCR